jgi:hypothetical protein
MTLKSISISIITLCMTYLSANPIYPQEIQTQFDIFRETAERLCQQLPENSTFRNTIMPWERCTKNLQYFLEEIEDPLISESALTECRSYISQFRQQSQFQPIAELAQKIMNDPDASIFQQYIAESVDGETPDRFLHLRTIEEDNPQDRPENATFLERNLGRPEEDQLMAFIDDILTQDSDIVWIHEVFIHSDAYEIFQSLRDKYVYFLYLADEIITESKYDGGVMIASKYPIPLKITYHNTVPPTVEDSEPQRIGMMGHQFRYALAKKEGGSSNRGRDVSVDLSVEIDTVTGKMSGNTGVGVSDGRGNHGRIEYGKSADENPKFKFTAGHDSKDSQSNSQKK